MQRVSKILKDKRIIPNYRNKYEFQAYGNRLADDLSDGKHRTLYIKLARETDRKLLEIAREFVMKNEHTTTRGKLFMWKLAQLKKEGIIKAGV